MKTKKKTTKAPNPAAKKSKAPTAAELEKLQAAELAIGPTVEEHFQAIPARDRAWQYAAFMAQYRPGVGKRYSADEFEQLRKALVDGPINQTTKAKEG